MHQFITGEPIEKTARLNYTGNTAGYPKNSCLPATLPTAATPGGWSNPTGTRRETAKSLAFAAGAGSAHGRAHGAARTGRDDVQ